MPSATAPAHDAALLGALRDARPYADYRAHLSDLLAQGKTTGPNQSELYLEIARLNQSRMDRLDKRPRLTPELGALLSGLRRDYLFLVLSEGWCGDAAQSVPVMNWLAEASPRIALRVALRDEHPALMDQYLTNGGRSIPKLLMLDAQASEVLADWGPRPLVAQALTLRYLRKPEPKEDYRAHHMELHRWYARDKTASTQAELGALLSWLEGEALGSQGER